MKNSFKITTFNAGLLDVKFLGKNIFTPVPYIKERLAALPDALLKNNADVIALQEIYEQEHKDFLISKLKKKYPYHFFTKNFEYRFQFENSLMFFSKVPFVFKKALPLKNTLIEEILVYKAALKIKIDVKGLGLVTLYNVHTTPGGLRKQDNAWVEKIRAGEIRQVIKSINGDSTDNLKIVLGDMNVGPEICKENYELFKQFNFVDLFKAKYPKEDHLHVTWDPKNSLNADGYYKNSVPQRIDHIFVKNKKRTKQIVKNIKMVFKEAIVRVGSRRKVTLSDHYGVSAVIE